MLVSACEETVQQWKWACARVVSILWDALREVWARAEPAVRILIRGAMVMAQRARNATVLRARGATAPPWAPRLAALDSISMAAQLRVRVCARTAPITELDARAAIAEAA
jgi:hypothetical protein